MQCPCFYLIKNMQASERRFILLCRIGIKNMKAVAEGWPCFRKGLCTWSRGWQPFHISCSYCGVPVWGRILRHRAAPLRGKRVLCRRRLHRSAGLAFSFYFIKDPAPWQAVLPEAKMRPAWRIFSPCHRRQLLCCVVRRLEWEEI